MIYQEIPLFGGDVKVLGNVVEYDDEVVFQAIIVSMPYSVEYDIKAVVYKEWTRKKFGEFDIDDIFPDGDPRIDRIAHKFKSMSDDRFCARFDTLLATRPSFDLP
jgi:hypothetical protein